MTGPSDNDASHELGTIQSVSDFLALIQPHKSGKGQHLFRGHRARDWKLIPPIGRRPSSMDIESMMLEEFKRRARPYVEAVSLSDTDWLAIAQHHGMPTRLLDWSGSALVALWFAVKDPSDGQPGAVWLLHPKLEDDSDLADEHERDKPLGLRETRLIRPHHVTRRITAQDGWFSLHNRNPSKTWPTGFVPLEASPRFAKRLHVVTIAPDRFGAIRHELGVAGIAPAVLFPDLDGIAQHVSWLHGAPTDELHARVGWPKTQL